MTEVASGSRRQTMPMNQKRRKPRRQSGAAVLHENKGSVVQRSRLERTDSDKVIRRNSMARKMSLHNNAIKLPQDFLQGLKTLDEEISRMSLTGSVRGSIRGSLRGSMNAQVQAAQTEAEKAENNPDSPHGKVFTDAQLAEMSKEALTMSDSDGSDDDDESVVLELEDPLEMEPL